MNNQLAIIEERVEAARKRLEVFEQLRDAVASDPTILDDLLAGLNGAPHGSSKPNAVAKVEKRERGRPPKDTGAGIFGGPVAAEHFEKVSQFFELRGNTPHSVAEIAKATGLKQPAVIQLCYRSHAVVFESVPVLGHKTKRKWRLTVDWKQKASSKD